ncbi:hypothetical protein FGO68_gene12917 [Halteria grandinella]|uniref:Sulfotransferase domain-containing protein n=1 Tax=Halteria grandinella TaxID=5974 RepID=A0A8J8NPC7_HALGN|nr:hypothetical protein FGO68_gene12917 [Halteria grandinella]
MLNVSLQYSAFKGEGHSTSSPKIPPSCWIHKTHYPYVIPYQKQLQGNQVLVCVRNPFDVFPSQFLKFCTMTHNLDINEDFTQFPEWKLHLSQEVGIWKRWHYYWIRMAQERRVPIKFVRFEDVREGKDEVLLKIMEYCLRGQISKESVIGRRIASGKERDGKVAYKPKKKRDNLTYYTEDQKLKIMTELRDLLRFFGYSQEKGKSSQPYFNIFNAECEEYWRDKALPEFKTNTFWSSDSINMLKEKQIHRYFDLPMKVTIKDPHKMPEPRD